jgi:hypothetical protein
VTCNDVTGSLAFSPPLTATGAGAGAGAETGTIRLHATGCATSGSNVSAVGSGTAAVSLTSPTSTCSGVLTLRPVALTTHWTPSTVTPSVLTFSGYSIASRPTGNGGFSFPDPGGTAKVTGSFAGGRRGVVVRRHLLRAVGRPAAGGVPLERPGVDPGDVGNRHPEVTGGSARQGTAPAAPVS